MNYQIPTQDELRVNLITALVRMRVHNPDFASEVIHCLEIVDEVASQMPPKPRRLCLVPTEAILGLTQNT